MNKKLSLIFFFIATVFAISCGVNKKNKTAYMQKTYESLKADLPNATVTILNDTIKVIFQENIMFATNSADISDAFLPHVVHFAKVLNKYKHTSVLVNGYTDNTGTKEYNDKLSKNRAENAKQSLIDNKVKNERIYAWGHGANDPVATNETVEGRQKNRRVEFVILYDVK